MRFHSAKCSSCSRLVLKPGYGAIGFIAVAFLCGTVFFGAGAAEDGRGGLDLPRWEEGMEDGFLGGGLWPDDYQSDRIVHSATPAPGEYGDPVDDSWLRFLPSALFGRKNNGPDSGPALVDLSAEALRACENSPADTRVIDPQGVLPEPQAEAFGRFLASHARQAGVEARFLMLDAGQQLSPDMDLSGVASGALQNGSSCLVVYPYGAPQRARIFLTRNVMKAVEPAYLENLAAICRHEAAEITDPFDQLQHFATQLSIRLFWLERAYPAVKAEPVGAARQPLHLKNLPPQKNAAGPDSEGSGPAVTPMPTLSEIAPGPLPQDNVASNWYLQAWLVRILAGLTGAGLLALIVLSIKRWQERRLRQTVWILPDYDHQHPVRFGGPHCGGCMATIKYGA